MKPQPAPKVPGDTPWERLDNAVRTIFAVSKAEIEKERTKPRRSKKRKRVNRRSKP